MPLENPIYFVAASNDDGIVCKLRVPANYKLEGKDENRSRIIFLGPDDEFFTKSNSQKNISSRLMSFLNDQGSDHLSFLMNLQLLFDGVVQSKSGKIKGPSASLALFISSLWLYFQARGFIFSTPYTHLVLVGDIGNLDTERERFNETFDKKRSFSILGVDKVAEKFGCAKEQFKSPENSVLFLYKSTFDWQPQDIPPNFAAHEVSSVDQVLTYILGENWADTFSELPMSTKHVIGKNGDRAPFRIKEAYGPSGDDRRLSVDEVGLKPSLDSFIDPQDGNPKRIINAIAASLGRILRGIMNRRVLYWIIGLALLVAYSAYLGNFKKSGSIESQGSSSEQKLALRNANRIAVRTLEAGSEIRSLKCRITLSGTETCAVLSNNKLMFLGTGEIGRIKLETINGGAYPSELPISHPESILDNDFIADEFFIMWARSQPNAASSNAMDFHHLSRYGDSAATPEQARKIAISEKPSRSIVTGQGFLRGCVASNSGLRNMNQGVSVQSNYYCIGGSGLVIGPIGCSQGAIYNLRQEIVETASGLSSKSHAGILKSKMPDVQNWLCSLTLDRTGRHLYYVSSRTGKEDTHTPNNVYDFDIEISQAKSIMTTYGQTGVLKLNKNFLVAGSFGQADYLKAYSIIDGKTFAISTEKDIFKYEFYSDSELISVDSSGKVRLHNLKEQKVELIADVTKTLFQDQTGGRKIFSMPDWDVKIYQKKILVYFRNHILLIDPSRNKWISAAPMQLDGPLDKFFVLNSTGEIIATRSKAILLFRVSDLEL